MNTFTQLANPGVASLGIYEPGRPVEEVARELGFSNVDEIVKLASNENELGPSRLALAAMRDAATEMHRYPDGGAFYLRRAIAERLDVKPEQVLPGNGSNELLELLGHTFLGPGRNVVVAEYAFIVYRLVAAMFGADVRSVPMRNLTHDLEAMAAAVDENTAILFVANPNNPTSTVVTPDEIAALMRNTPDRTIVCFDEAYIELLPPEERADTLAYVREGRSVVVMRTFSKAYGLAGLRIGYGIAPEECVDLMNRVRQPFNVNAMAQAAALAALDDEEHVARTRIMLREGTDYIRGALEQIGVPSVPGSANFMLVETGNGREVFRELQRLGVIVRPMDGYRLPDYVRVTIGTQEQNERFVAALCEVLGKARHE